MGSGGGSSTTANEYPAWAVGQAQDMLDYAGKVMSRDYTPYGLQRIADTSADTQAGYGLIRNAASGFDPTAYLAQNKDVSDYYLANKDSLAANGVTNSTDFAKFHWDQFGQAEGRKGADSLADSNSLLRQAGAYQPIQIAAYNPVSAQSVSAKNIGNLAQLSAGQLASTDLSPYLNPYTNEVTNRAVNEIERANAMANQRLRTGSAGAYGSSGARAALLEGENNRNALEQAQTAAAQIGERGYMNAQQAALADIGNRLQADQYNIGMDYQTQQANQQANLNAALANANNALQADQFNISSDLQRNNLNMSALQQQAAMQLAAGQALSGTAMNGQALKLANAQALMGIGQQQEGKEQAALSMAYEDYLRQLGYPVDMLNLGTSALAQTIGKSGSQTTETETDNTGQIVSALGTMAMAAASMMSDRRVKKNIQRVGALDNGLPVYVFNYIGDPRPVIGLMAQDVEEVKPDAVAEINGIKHVNYAIAVQEI